MKKKWIAVIAGLLLIGGGALLIPRINFEYQKYQKAEKEKQQIAAVEKGIRMMMVDPDSAQFRYVRARSSENPHTPGNYMFIVCGQFNAKNRMGGYTGYRDFVFDSLDDKKLQFDPDEPNPFASEREKNEYERQKVIFRTAKESCPPIID